MSSFKKLILAAALLWISLNSLTVLAQDKSVAIVVRATGPVSLLRESQEASLLNRAEIFVGDQIITGSEAWVTMNFYDLTRVVLRPDSKFTIHKFPQTMGASEVRLELEEGGARVTAGTNSTGSAERFSLLTPDGEIHSGRSEWVVRICNEDECEALQQSFSRCFNYQNPSLKDKQFVSVYKGSVKLDYCPSEFSPEAGTTASSELSGEACEIIQHVPCVVLSDAQLGKDKLQTFLPNIPKTPESEAKQQERASKRPPRPQSRPPMPRPRVNRPPRPRP